MTKHEAKRLALLVIWNEIDLSLDASDEWASHPENGNDFTLEEYRQVKAAGIAWFKKFTDRLPVDKNK